MYIMKSILRKGQIIDEHYKTHNFLCHGVYCKIS